MPLSRLIAHDIAMMNFLANGLFLLLVTFLVAVMYVAFTRTAQGPSFRQFRITIAAVTGFWLVLTASVAATGFYADFQSMPPRFLTLLIPPLIGLIFLYRSHAIASLLGSFTQSQLIGLQSFRIIMEFILWLLYLEGKMPVQMTFEGRNFDIIVGLTAPLLAQFIIRGNISNKVIILWNVLCMLILANTVITAALSAPTPFRVFMNEPANTVIAYFPFVWLPAFVVPFAFALHLLSIKKALIR